MADNSSFFLEQTEQSKVKAHIVSSYFRAWSYVIKKWNGPMGYVDLFCGPGKYENDQPSAPLLIINSTLADPVLASKMHFIFNDNDSNNIAALQENIASIPGANSIKNQIHLILILSDYLLSHQ